MRKAAKMLLLGEKKVDTTPWYLAGGVLAADCIAAYQAVGVGSLERSKVNLANPGTYDLTVPSGQTEPDWSSTTGWTGTGKYYDTGIIPDSLTLSMIVRFSGAADSDDSNGLLGVTSSDYLHPFLLHPRRAAGLNTFGNGTGSATLGPAILYGTLALSLRTYVNGVPGASDWTRGASSYPYSEGIWLRGIKREGGAVYRGFNGNFIAASFYNRLITTAEVEALHAAIMKLPF